MWVAECACRPEKGFQGKGIKISQVHSAFRVLASQCVSACTTSSVSESPAVHCCRDAAADQMQRGSVDDKSSSWKRTADRSNTNTWSYLALAEFLKIGHCLFTPKRLNGLKPVMLLHVSPKKLVCELSWVAFQYTCCDWLNWLLLWLPSFSYQSAIKKKKSNLGLMGQAPCRHDYAKKTMHLPRHERTAYVRAICCLALTLWSPMVTAKQQSQRVNGPNLISCFNSNLVNEIHWRPQAKTTGVSSLFKPKRLSSEKYSLKSQQSHWNCW